MAGIVPNGPVWRYLETKPLTPDPQQGPYRQPNQGANSISKQVSTLPFSPTVLSQPYPQSSHCHWYRTRFSVRYPPDRGTNIQLLHRAQVMMTRGCCLYFWSCG